MGGTGTPRANVTRVCIVISDGLSDNRTATALEARRRRRGASICSRLELERTSMWKNWDAIAGQPTQYYRFLVENFEGLGNIRELMAIKTCTGEIPHE